MNTKIINYLLMHTGRADHPLCRHVINPEVAPSAVTYPGLHLYCVCLFKGYVNIFSEKNPFSISISDFAHVSKREKAEERINIYLINICIKAQII